MSQRIRLSATVVMVGALSLPGFHRLAEASGWQQTTGYPPVTQVYRPAVPVAATATAPQPVTVARPLFGGCNTCTPAAATPAIGAAPLYQPWTVRFAPRTWFRSRWVRVPVTAYRPAAVVGQPGCAPVTQLQPCNTYRWQLQRVPVYRPVFAWMPRCGVAATPSLFGASVPAATGCGNCAPAVPAATTVPSPAPYYQPPAAGATVAPAPAGSSPSPVPADNAPRLKPGEVPGTGGGVSTQPAQPATQPPGAALRNPTQQYRPYSDVTPIPATQPPKPAPHQNIPALLDPRGRTASLRAEQEWAVMPVGGNQQPASSLRQPRTAAPPNVAPSRQQAADRWDDGGWHAAR